MLNESLQLSSKEGKIIGSDHATIPGALHKEVERFFDGRIFTLANFSGEEKSLAEHLGIGGIVYGNCNLEGCAVRTISILDASIEPFRTITGVNSSQAEKYRRHSILIVNNSRETTVVASACALVADKDGAYNGILGTIQERGGLVIKARNGEIVANARMQSVDLLGQCLIPCSYQPEGRPVEITLS